MAFNFDGNYTAGLDPALIAYYNAQNQAYLNDPRAYAASVASDPFSLAANSKGGLGLRANGYTLASYTDKSRTKPGHYEGDTWVDAPQETYYQVRNADNTGAVYDSTGKYLGDFNANKDDMADLAVMALVGGAFGGVAAGAAAGAGGTGLATTAGGTAGGGISGFGDAGLMYAGADGAALGGGASIGGGALLPGAAGGAVTGLGDAGMMYAGADGAAAGSLGGGASINGGAMLGPAGAGSSLGAAGLGGGGGVTPPNPYYSTSTGGLGSSGIGSSLSNVLGGNGSMSDYLGLGATALGALGGAQGVNQSATSTKTMDPRLDPYVYSSLLPTSTGLLGSQLPLALQNQQALQKAGMGLLGTSTTPDFANNPYMTSVADDLQRRTQLLLGSNNLAIQGNAVASGGLGGSRQGVAQGLAAGQAADSLQGNLATLYGNEYDTQANRALQAQTLGAGMLSQSLSSPWVPIQQQTQTISPFTGLGSTTASATQGGGAMGALGGALGAAQIGKAAGWW